MSIFAPLGNTNVTRGHGIQNDVFSSNVTVNCDPRLVVPQTEANARNGLIKPEIAGNIAVEHDLCDLDVRNLTIHGTLIVPGDTVLSCTVIKADGAVCCPLTVENTNVPVAGGQVGNALCVEGSTVMQPVTDPATSEPGQALLFLDGTQPNVLLTNDYMRIDARALSGGTAIDISLDSNNVVPVAMTGTGIKVVKGGSTMTSGANSRLMLLTASTENGLDQQTEPITLAEVNGPNLVDFSSGGADPPGFSGIRKTALWVNSTPTASPGVPIPLSGYAPVMGFLVDGGTTFRGRNGDNGRGHGHVHVAQQTPPKLILVEENGTAFTDTTEDNVVFPNQNGIFDYPPVDEFGTDVAGVIQITATNVSSPFFVQIAFQTPFPDSCVPSITVSPEFKSFVGQGPSGQVTTTQTANTLVIPRNEGFLIGPLVNPQPGVATTVGIIHYKVLGVIKA